ncbi:MAG: hypothetical protein IKO35_07045 [Elusimicrobiaceae bacterium]|nr:hypothetical protein [Elusimicrobiaceae bacterium]
MRYILYICTMAVLFVGGMLVGNIFLPARDASLAAAVSAPGLPTDNPILQTVTREQAKQDLETLQNALSSCPVIVSEEKNNLLNRILLRLAMENFELKRLKLELEIAKNNETNRPTAQLTQAHTEYVQARERVEKLAEELFPTKPLPLLQTKK